MTPLQVIYAGLKNVNYFSQREGEVFLKINKGRRLSALQSTITNHQSKMVA